MTPDDDPHLLTSSPAFQKGGILGGILSAGLAMLGLWAVRHRRTEEEEDEHGRDRSFRDRLAILKDFRVVERAEELHAAQVRAVEATVAAVEESIRSSRFDRECRKAEMRSHAAKEVYYQAKARLELERRDSENG